MCARSFDATAHEWLQHEKTPLHRAAEHGHERVVAYLVGRGASIEARDSVSDVEGVRMMRCWSIGHGKSAKGVA